MHFALGERLGLSALVARILTLPREDRWQSMARAALRDDLHAVHAQLTAQVLAETDGDAAGAGAHRRLGGGRRGGRLPRGRDTRRDLRRRPRRPGPALGRTARSCGRCSPHRDGGDRGPLGAASSTATSPPSTTSASPSRRARSSASSAPTARARPRRWRWSRGCAGPTAAECRLLGEPTWPRNPALLPRIGVQLQASAFFDRLTAREQIRTFAALYGVPRPPGRRLARAGRAHRQGRHPQRASCPGGQLQRLADRLRAGARARAGVPRRADRGRWTRRPGATCGTCSARSTTRAAPSCSPRTTWTRPRRSATGSRSWTHGRILQIGHPGGAGARPRRARPRLRSAEQLAARRPPRAIDGVEPSRTADAAVVLDHPSARREVLTRLAERGRAGGAPGPRRRRWRTSS